MSTTITVDNAAAALNRHHIVYDKMIHTTVKKEIELERYLKPVTTAHTYTAASAEIQDLVQAYQPDFTPNSQTDFKAVDNPLERMKVDIQFEADELDQFYDTWMAEWVEDGKSRKEWSFPRYIYDKHVIPKIIENLDFISFNGVRAAPVAGTAGVKVGSANGLKKKIADAITAGLVTPIATGVLGSATMVNQVETFCDSIPVVYRNLPGVILMSDTNAKKYVRDYRDKFSVGNGVMNENKELRIDYSRKRVFGVGTIEGSDGMIFLPDNLAAGIYGRRKTNKQIEPYLPKIRWQEFDRKLKGLTEFSRFWGFKYWGHIFVNDQF
jgi:hypothetical protein